MSQYHPELRSGAIVRAITPCNTFSWFRLKIKKLTFDTNHWIKEVKKVKRLRV